MTAIVFLCLALVAAPEAATVPAPLRARLAPPPASPEVAADGRVTFRLRADKAQTVTVSGDWPGAALPLVRAADGVWSATLGPLAPDIYGYSFTLDGVRIADPGNAAVKPSRWPATSILELPSTPPAAWDRQSRPAGTVHIERYDSKPLGRERVMRVYTPPGYEKGSKAYPVLYLFHGYSDTQDAWSELGRAGVIADNLIAGKAIEPLLIVMTDGHAVPPEPERWARNLVDFERDLLAAVVPFVDAHYRTRKSAAERAIIGLSMGGFQSLAIGLGHPDTFAWVGGMSAALWDGSVFEPALARPEALKKGTRLIWFACGKDDFLIQENRAFDRLLTDKGVPHVWRETAGAHTWPVWRRYLVEFLPLLWKPAPR